VAGVKPPRPKIGAVEVAVVVGVAVVVNFKGVEVGAELAREIPTHFKLQQENEIFNVFT
jgi:hypothetical protein